MRTLIIALSLAALATPALAQNPQTQIEILRAQQEAATRRAIDQDNQLSALQNRLQTEQAVSQLQAQRNAPRLPDLPYVAPSGSGSTFVLQKYPSIPDAALADSNRRVRAVSPPR